MNREAIREAPIGLTSAQKRVAEATGVWERSATGIKNEREITESNASMSFANA
jgi:hypothetical protein